MSATVKKPDTPAEKPAKISVGGVKKGRNEGLKIVTANRLVDGVVVYQTDDQQWTEDLGAATIVEGEDALALLDWALTDEGHVVGPYLMDVDEAETGVQPDGRGRLREEIRDRGPTIHPQFGRQARGQA
ncbi:DUF2849 domain-containing protein [Parvularcula sp. LCG005]|uniref:DUF2849 domain-containing protein n=1 Tax=Parvularcula sp. LCG005 TaxID=3078805 RepID=UPI0029434BC7|nr:DUF2849 domain-containing protein [Parvularcula sp. LCG005]WOI53134.1 DUF2849 domain-containing protein [Parvularcula sp. LCG005]